MERFPLALPLTLTRCPRPPSSQLHFDHEKFGATNAVSSSSLAVQHGRRWLLRQ